MRVIRYKNSITVVLSGNRIIQSSECTDEMFEQIKKFQQEDNEFEAINLLIPEEPSALEETRYRNYFIQTVNDAKTSSVLTTTRDGRNTSIYWYEVSPLSMPPELAERILKAEKENNPELLETYKNFWTLTSLNPSAVVRNNLFKFLNKWGMTISKSGLFVGYRNAEVKVQGDTPETTVYTDHHSHTTTIKIGEPVSIPISQCDTDSSIECSRGLMCSPLRK